MKLEVQELSGAQHPIACYQIRFWLLHLAASHSE